MLAKDFSGACFSISLAAELRHRRGNLQQVDDLFELWLKKEGRIRIGLNPSVHRRASELGILFLLYDLIKRLASHVG